MTGIELEGVRWVEYGETGDGRRGGAAAGAAALVRAAAVLEAGGVVAHPTSTVYGLGGRPVRAVDARVAVLKGRAAGPLIRLAASRAAVRAALPTARWTDAARRLADAWWPGPLTLVLDDGSAAGVAVRVDADPVVRRLLERVGGLMTSTSLNVTGGAPARTRREARAVLAAMPLEGGPAGWLDAGDLPPSAPSTLVRIDRDAVEVLREGAVPARDIERLAGRAGPPGGPA